MAKSNSFPVFTGGTDAVVHVAKPGTSQKIKVSQLVDALGHILVAGDIVRRPTKVYPDALPCDGETYQSATYPELASKLGAATTFNTPIVASNIVNISYYIKT